MSSEALTSIDQALGAAIRAARFSRGLTQRDLAEHLKITRATLASYETGRRKIAAETLLSIARLCEKPLAFFEQAANGQSASRSSSSPVQAAPMGTQQPAMEALTQALAMRPDALPIVMEFLEAWLQDQTRPE